jgi:predicted DNA-binding transcriptional regulator AlpA
MDTEPEHLWTEREVSDFLANVSLRTLRRWRQAGRGPAYVKVGRRVMYRPSDIQTWIDEHTIRRDKKGAP